MKRLHKKILIVIGLKIAEILMVATCIATFVSIVYGIAWLIATLGAYIVYGATWLITTSGIVTTSRIAFIYIVFGAMALYGLYLAGTWIKEWFAWNWSKAERILTRNKK